MASISSLRPYLSTSAPISAIGFRMPLVVSQCTANTCVMVGIGLQRALDLVEVGRRVLRRLVHLDPAPGDQADPLGALAVGAVDEQQHLARARHEGGEHGLDGEGARALHRHGHVGAPRIHDLGQALQHLLVDGEEGGVARAPVVDHRLLDAPGGRQGAGRQKQRIAGFGRPARCFPLGHVQLPQGSSAISNPQPPQRLDALRPFIKSHSSIARAGC